MLPRVDATGTRPVTLVEASLPATAVGQPRQEALDRLLQLTLGREYQAQVLSRLNDGSFLVRIDTAAASMKLPPGTKPGDTLEMTLLATQPRPTFLLGRAEAGVTASLSNAGRLIGNMLQLAGQEGARPAAVTGTAPLAASAATPAPQVAAALRNAVGMSGLFYESHVAQWAAGARPLNDLLRESAVKRLPTATTATGATPPAADSEETATAALARLPNPAQAMPPSAAAAGRAASAALAMSQDAVEAVMARTQQAPDAPLLEHARLLNQQLDTLEHRRFLWQGELFPGQAMEWEINDETPQHKPDQAEAEAVWSSSMRFTMPDLGAIAATIRLSGDRVQVQLAARDEETAMLLRRHGPLLADSLDAAGTTLDALSVRGEE